MGADEFLDGKMWHREVFHSLQYQRGVRTPAEDGLGVEKNPDLGGVETS